MRGVKHCIYLHLVTLGMGIFQMHAGQPLAVLLPSVKLFCLSATACLHLIISLFYALTEAKNSNEPLPKIRFKLFSWEKDKKKWKILIPVFHFKLRMGGEKKDPFVFVWVSSTCLLLVLPSSYVYLYVWLSIWNATCIWLCPRVPLNVTRKFMYLRRRLMGNLKWAAPSGVRTEIIPG